MIATPRAAIIFSASKGAKKQKHRDLAYFPGDKLGVFLLDVFTSCEARIASFRSGGIISQAAGPICLVNRNDLDFSLMFHDVKSPTRRTLISQEVGVSLTLTQRESIMSRQTAGNEAQRNCQSVLSRLYTPGMGVNLWGESPLYMNPRSIIL
jgi:hypothetical protein